MKPSVVDKKHPAEKYCRDIVAGVIPSNRLTKLACERHVRDLAEGWKRGLWFDPIEAQDHIDFFQFLKHSKGEWSGTSFKLEPWQQFIIYCLFGWKRADGLRRFREAYVEVPRKNGKSTLAAGIGLDLFIADGEPGAEVYCAATKKDQARIVYKEAERMRAASPSLSRRIEKFRDNMSIPGTASKFEPLGADEDTLDGLNIHGAIIDEYHAHKTAKVAEVIDTATSARRQPMSFTITTAGSDRQSPCYKQHHYCEQVLEQILDDDRLFAIIYALDLDDDWTDSKNWTKSNPNLNVSCKQDDLQGKALKAQNKPSYQNAYLRLHHNIWTEQETRWLSIEKWKECVGYSLEARDPWILRQEMLEKLLGRRCMGALDLSSKNDLTCYMKLFFPTEEDPLWILIPEFYVPAENVKERVARDRVGYDVWIREKFLTATPGNVIDYDFIKAQILRDKSSYELERVAFDPWNATQLATQLVGEGVEMVEFRQGYASLSEPTKNLETLVLGHKLAHLGNPVLTWNASNIVIKEDEAGNIKPDKSKKTEKIDGIVALIMAIGLAQSAPADSVSDSGGITLL
jgi:phage terminase large subunit-like protein